MILLLSRARLFSFGPSISFSFFFLKKRKHAATRRGHKTYGWNLHWAKDDDASLSLYIVCALSGASSFLLFQKTLIYRSADAAMREPDTNRIVVCSYLLVNQMTGRVSTEVERKFSLRWCLFDDGYIPYSHKWNEFGHESLPAWCTSPGPWARELLCFPKTHTTNKTTSAFDGPTDTNWLVHRVAGGRKVLGWKSWRARNVAALTSISLAPPPRALHSVFWILFPTCRLLLLLLDAFLSSQGGRVFCEHNDNSVRPLQGRRRVEPISVRLLVILNVSVNGRIFLYGGDGSSMPYQLSNSLSPLDVYTFCLHLFLLLL